MGAFRCSMGFEISECWYLDGMDVSPSARILSTSSRAFELKPLLPCIARTIYYVVKLVLTKNIKSEKSCRWISMPHGLGWNGLNVLESDGFRCSTVDFGWN